MHRKHTLASTILATDSFGVTVYPNVDYAFIAALVVILDEINADRSGENYIQLLEWFLKTSINADRSGED